MYLWSILVVEYQNSSQPPMPLKAKSLIAAHFNLNGLDDQESQLVDPQEKFLQA